MACINYQAIHNPDHQLEFPKVFPNPFSAPTDEPLMYTTPLPVIRRQVTPGRSDSQYPNPCVDKTVVILSNPTLLALFSRQMWFKQLPYFIGYAVSVIVSIHLSVSYLLRYFHPTPICVYTIYIAMTFHSFCILSK